MTANATTVTVRNNGFGASLVSVSGRLPIGSRFPVVSTAGCQNRGSSFECVISYIGAQQTASVQYQIEQAPGAPRWIDVQAGGCETARFSW
ncbi:MAG: hypothetical protein H0U56_10820 [Methylibium sp.]|nr:hypothetical protein [Methylibium sp.]